MKFAALGFALLVPLAHAGGTPHEVRIEGMQFQPAVLTVQRGDTLRWRNADLVPHTASAKGAFDSGNIAPGQTFSRAMDQPGTFDYVCNYHPGMKGRVVVR